MDCSLPGSSVHGIFQARILEWVAISFSRGSSQPRDQSRVSCIADRRFTIWATREAPRKALRKYNYPENTVNIAQNSTRLSFFFSLAVFTVWPILLIAISSLTETRWKWGKFLSYLKCNLLGHNNYHKFHFSRLRWWLL